MCHILLALSFFSRLSTTSSLQLSAADSQMEAVENDYYYLLSLYLFLCHYCRLYGAQILLMTGLSAMTLFRREMSCNREYNREGKGEECSDMDDSGGNNVTLDTELLLEEAGYFCSGGPLLAILSKIWESLALFGSEKGEELLGERKVYVTDPAAKRKNFFPRSSLLSSLAPTPFNETLQHKTDSSSQLSSSQKTACYLTQILPPDSLIHILTFLPAKDLINFACVCRSTSLLIDGENHPETNLISSSLWREMFKRDYHQIINWDGSKRALERSSLCPYNIPSHLQSYNRSLKELYFLFGETWLDWSVAGQNTVDHCLVGLHGSVFDITKFINYHPGSPETLLMHSGRDATEIFEDVGHSKSARLLAESYRVVSDGRLESALPRVRSVPRRAGCLEMVRRRVQRERKGELAKAEKWKVKELTDGNILGDVNVYFDVFNQRWKWWYMGMDFSPVYCLDGREVRM